MGQVINSRPIVFISFFFAVGIALSYYLCWEFFPLIVCFVLFLGGLVLCIATKKLRTLFLIYAVFFVLGALLFTHQYNTYFSGIKSGAEYTITGRVTNRQLDDYNRYTLDGVILKDEEGTIEFGKRIFLYSREILAYGDVVEFSGNVEPPSTVRNPGGFDQKMYLASHGVGFTSFASEVWVVDSRPGIYGPFLFLRESIAEKIDMYFAPSTAPFAKAMFLGFSSEIPQEVRDNYGITGIAHVLAISGLHIAVIAAAFQFLLKKLKVPRNMRFSVNIAALIGYALLTGLAPSVLRAVIMSVLVLVGRWRFAKRDTLTFLGIAILITLLFSTPQLFMPGFLLSYAVVFGLLCLMPPINRWFEKLRFSNKFSAMLGASGAASVAAFPLTAYFFQSISLSAIVANFFAIPLAMIIVVFTGLFAAFCVIPPIAAILAILPQLAIELMNTLNNMLAGTNFGYIETQAFPVIAGVFVFALLFVCSDYLLIGRKLKGILSVTLIALVVVSWGTAYASQNNYDMKMTVLDVGTGDIVHIQTSEKNYLIDDGGNLQSAQLTEYTKNNRIVYDAVVEANDRTSNLQGIMEQGAVRQMFVQEKYQPKEYEENLQMNHYALYDKIELDANLTLRVIAGDEKHMSFLLEAGGKPLCLIAQNDADVLMEQGIAVPIVKLAKGGTAKALTVRMVDAMRPKVAMISVKKDNRNQLPDVGTIAVLAAKGVQVYNTAYDGAIVVTWHKDGSYEVNTMK